MNRRHLFRGALASLRLEVEELRASPRDFQIKRLTEQLAALRQWQERARGFPMSHKPDCTRLQSATGTDERGYRSCVYPYACDCGLDEFLKEETP